MWVLKMKRITYTKKFRSRVFQYGVLKLHNDHHNISLIFYLDPNCRRSVHLQIKNNSLKCHLLKEFPSINQS